MANVHNYDEKAAYDQRYRSSYGHQKNTSSSSNSSTTSSTSCNDDKCDSCHSNRRPFSYPADGKLHGERRVRFMVEKPLPPGWVANWNWDVAQKRRHSGMFGGRDAKDEKRARREIVDEWWRNGGQGLEPYDSDEEDEDEDADKEKEES